MRGSVSRSWEGDRTVTVRRVANASLKVFKPVNLTHEAPPEGFSTATDFLKRVKSKGRIAERLPEARKKIAERRARSGPVNTLSQLRLEKGLSQDELAQMIGTKQPIISMYESGQREPSLSTIRVLAKALDVSFNVLVPALK